MKKLIYILSFIMIITLMIPIKALADDNVDGKGSTVGDSETKNVQDYQDNVAEKGQENTGAALRIDNSNVYEGMDKAYSKGYSPKIRNNKAVE
jgi:hypothetical protein